MPVYSLIDVHKAASKQLIQYRGRGVLRDASNLGYEKKDVCQCILSLKNSDFRKTTRYPGTSTPPDDEYEIRYSKPLNSEYDEPTIDELYIKFCLVDERLSIDLGSFHQPRYANTWRKS